MKEKIKYIILFLLQLQKNMRRSIFSIIQDKSIWKSDVWSVITALSTLAAVIVSLYLANKKEKRKKELFICEERSENAREGKIFIYITIENTGNTPIILQEYGDDCGKYQIDLTINNYLVDDYKPIMIKPNEAIMLTYKYDFGREFQENDEIICKSYQYLLFKKLDFKARDNLANFYSVATNIHKGKEYNRKKRNY